MISITVSKGEGKTSIAGMMNDIIAEYFVAIGTMTHGILKSSKEMSASTQDAVFRAMEEALSARIIWLKKLKESLDNNMPEPPDDIGYDLISTETFTLSDEDMKQLFKDVQKYGTNNPDT